MSQGNDQVTIKVTGFAARVRDEIANSQQPDPTKIAQSVRDEIDEASLDQAIRLYVQRVERSMRREARIRAEADARALESVQRNQQRKEEAQGDLEEIAARHEQLVADRFFSSWKETPSGRKFLGDCTAGDLKWSAERNQRRGEGVLEAAERDRRLAAAVTAAGCISVRDLGYEAAVQAISSSRGAA